MSSQDYLKEAAAMLRRAALARKQEADELRHLMDQKEQERHNLLNQKEQERIKHLDFAANSDSDAERGKYISKAQLLSTEKGKIDQDYNYQRRQLDEQLNTMQRSVDSLNQMAQNIGG
jgi:hypothetical protein